MTPEIAVGLIGLGGALGGAFIGGLATFAGVVYQQNRYDKHVSGERQTTMTHQAIDVIMDQTWELKKLAVGSSDKQFEWTNDMAECVEAIRLAALRLPEKHLREPIEAACLYKFGASRTFKNDRIQGPPQPAARVAMMAGQVQERLGAYLRGEPIPPVDGFLEIALENEKELYRKLGWRKRPGE